MAAGADFRRSGGYAARRRRTRWRWSVAALLLVAGFALLVNSRSAETRRQTAFFDATRILAQEADQIAAGFSRLIAEELHAITRDDFDLLMDQIESQMAGHAQALKELEAPDSARAPREMLDLAFDSWTEGLDEFRAAITDVTDSPTSTAPVDRLAGAVVLLRVGDLIYARFLDRARLMIANLDVTISDFPMIAFISEHRALLNGERLARTVRSSTQMGVRRDVSILQVVFDPIPSGGVGQDGEMIFPATDRLQFSAVIGNRGNVDQKGLEVSVGMRSEDGEPVAAADSPPIDLSPGEIGSVIFPAQPVDPGAEYQLIFNLTVLEEEIDTQDNVWESAIRINPPG